MAPWLRITLVVASAVGGFGASIVVSAPLHRLLVRCAGRRVAQALCVVVGYYLLMAAAALVVGGIAASLDDAGHDIAVVLLMCASLAGLSVLVYPLMPGGYPNPEATEARALSRAGATTSVSQALAWPAALLSFVVGLPLLGVFAIVPLVVG